MKLDLPAGEHIGEHTGNVDFLEVVTAVDAEDMTLDCALVLEVLHRPLAYEALGDGSPGITVARVAQLTGLSGTRTQEVLKHLVADGTLERSADGRYVSFVGLVVDR